MTLYEFVLDATDVKNPSHATYEQPFTDTAIYLRSEFNDWGINDKFEYRGE